MKAQSHLGKTCVLCGEHPSTRKGDHQPPECLYPPPRPLNVKLNSVPACTGCNGAGSYHDEEFKLMLGLLVGEHRDDSLRVVESIQRTLIKNKRLIKHLALKSTPGYANRGRGVLEPVRRVDFDGKAYHNVISRIVRGLHWQETGAILSPQMAILVRPFSQLNGVHAQLVQELMNMVPAKQLNLGTFAYKHAYSTDASSLWVLQFFGAHQAFAMVSNGAQPSLPTDIPASAAEARTSATTLLRSS